MPCTCSSATARSSAATRRWWRRRRRRACQPSCAQTLGAAAVRAAKAIGYVGAGTIEFLLDPGGAFYFMEMNTRLQVEHPVTELITDLDLVEWQLRVAAGQPLPRSQDKILFCGHAIEARLYAEDPARGFLPATGRLAHLRWPELGPHVRVDTGIRAGDEISIHYDPMIAKLAVWGEDRFAAVRRLRTALSTCQIAGLRHNVDFLRAVASHPAFEAADLDTAFIERHRADLLPADGAQPLLDAWAIACAELTLYQEQIAREAALKTGDPWSPWSAAKGWRLNGEGHGEIRLRSDGTLHKIAVTYKPDGYLFALPAGRRLVRAQRLGRWRRPGRHRRSSRHRHGGAPRLPAHGVHRRRYGPVRAGRSAGRERASRCRARPSRRSHARQGHPGRGQARRRRKARRHPDGAGSHEDGTQHRRPDGRQDRPASSSRPAISWRRGRSCWPSWRRRDATFPDCRPISIYL